MSIPTGIRELLVCPRCHGPLRDAHQPAADAPGASGTGGNAPESVAISDIVTALDCVACGLQYPVRDGIPVMLVDQATPLGPTVA